MLRRIAIWTAAALLGLFFVLVGFSKFAGPSGAAWALRLSHWGYPAASRYAIGGIEVLAGLGLLVPPLRRWSAISLMLVMAGALLTHLIHGEFLRVLPPLILGGILYGLYSWRLQSSQKSQS